MGNWTAETSLEPIEFDGDLITFTVGRLLVEDMAEVMQNYNPTTEKLTFTDPAEVCGLAAKIVPKYVKGIRGMKKPDGTEFTVAEFADIAGKQFYFTGLVGALFGGLVSASVVGQAVKNSEPPSAE